MAKPPSNRLPRRTTQGSRKDDRRAPHKTVTVSALCAHSSSRYDLCRPHTSCTAPQAVVVRVWQLQRPLGCSARLALLSCAGSLAPSPRARGSRLGLEDLASGSRTFASGSRIIEVHRAVEACQGLSRLCRVSRLDALTPVPHGVSGVLYK